MKMMSAKEAKNSFGVFLDAAQREPVVVTKRDRPVGVMFSMDDFPAMEGFVASMQHEIRQGVEAGLAEADAGAGAELNDAYTATLKHKLAKRLAAKTEV